MTHDTAAAMQFRRASYYTVWLTAPAGTGLVVKYLLGLTPRKTGGGLLSVVGTERVQAVLRRVMTKDLESVTLKKAAGALVLSNGWRVAFGGTVRQETAESGEIVLATG